MAPQVWVDKLEIRELIERSMRYLDDEAGGRLAELFADDGVLQVAGTGWVIVNRTGVSVGRPGDEGTDKEWARALERMSAQTRAQFRVT